jgi:general secretion pathway protein F
MPTSHSSLSFRIRADLYTQLAALEKGGLPTDRAFALLDLPRPVQPRLVKARAYLAKGVEIAASGVRSGLFTELEATLIRAATSAGSPAVVYRRLADYYTQRARQASAIRSRLALPALVLVVALFVQPLPALLTGSLGLGGYLVQCLRPLIALGGIAWLVTSLPDWINRGPSTPTRAWIERALLALPLFGDMHKRRNIRDFFESLALMLEAGIPILDALPKAVETIRNHQIQSSFAKIKKTIEHGATLAQALSVIPFLENSPSIALINTGENSGALPEMLFRYAAMETAAINHFHEQVAAWLPRIVYAAIAAWIAYGILAGAGVAPTLPADLR